MIFVYGYCIEVLYMIIDMITVYDYCIWLLYLIIVYDPCLWLLYMITCTSRGMVMHELHIVTWSHGVTRSPGV